MIDSKDTENTAGKFDEKLHKLIKRAKKQRGLLWPAVVSKLELARAERANFSVLMDSDLDGLVVSVWGQVKPVFTAGNINIVEKFGDVRLEYPVQGFFQINVEAFRIALDHIREATPDEANILELYAGVGAIGLNIAAKVTKITAFESEAMSTEAAMRNAKANLIKNFKIQTARSEQVSDEDIKSANCIILDPPRTGLDRRLTEKLVAAKPERLIYLSCNPVTQARDLARLGEDYALESFTGFDFYPGTPHVESLAVLVCK